MAEQKLKVNIVGDASKLTKALNTASGKLESFGSKVSGIGKSLTTRLTLPLGIAGGAAIKMASDFEESLNKVNVAFGEASGTVRDFAKTTLQQFGIAQGTALDMAALFGDMSTSMGLSVDAAADLSTSLVGLAGDLASFKNMNIEEVTTALAGVFTGETESLKRLGIVMTQVNLEQFAMEQGIKKTIKEMTQAEKVQLRYQFVMSKTANAQGDFARTSEGAANQMRIFQESMKELGASFGAVILPAFTKLVQKANAVLLKFKDLDEGTKKTIMIIGGIAAAIGPVLVVLGSMSSGIGLVASGFATALPIIIKVVSAFKNLTIAMLANPVGAIAAAVVTLIAGFVEYLHRLEPAVSRTKTFFNILKSLGNPLKFAALQAEDAAKALAQKKKDAEAAAKANAELKASLENLGKPLVTATKEAENLGTALRDIKTVSAISLTVEKGDFDAATGEFAGGDIAVGAQQVSTDGIGGISAPDPGAVDAGVKGLLAMQQQAQQTAVALDNLAAKQERLQELGNMIGGEVANAFYTFGEAAIGALGLAENGFGRFLGGMASTVLQLISMFLAQSIAQAVAGASASAAATGPAAIITQPAFIATAVGGILSAFAAIPKFANGGIVSGPTMGLMGEYPGAKSNPEVIAPLDKLQGMMGGSSQNVNVGGEFKINGQDLVVALQRADRNRSRIK
jgi:hypothetical protein